MQFDLPPDATGIIVRVHGDEVPTSVETLPDGRIRVTFTEPPEDMEAFTVGRVSVWPLKPVAQCFRRDCDSTITDSALIGEKCHRDGCTGTYLATTT